MMSFGWLGKSVIAAALFIVPFLSAPFFNRNFSLRPEAVLVWYAVGLAFGCFGWGLALNVVKFNELSFSWPLFAAAIVGALFSALPNILLYQALTAAPNPGLPMAVINISTVLTFFAALILAGLFPRWFSAAKFDWIHFSGIVLVVFGVALISWRR